MKREMRKEEIKKVYVINESIMKEFYASEEWKMCKEWAYKRFKRICVRCKKTSNLSVDHIRPISCHPKRAFSDRNLRLLCLDRNKRKSFLIPFRHEMKVSDRFINKEFTEPLLVDRFAYKKFFKKIDDEELPN